MNQLFEATIRYTKENEEGLLKVVTEKYLFSALNHTDAEANVHTVFSEVIRGDFFIPSLTIVNASTVINQDGDDKWFKVKFSYIPVVDEKMKRVTDYAYVNAPDAFSAISYTDSIVNNGDFGRLNGFFIEGVQLTKIEESYVSDDKFLKKTAEEFEFYLEKDTF
jgi:hypothetical protein